MTLNRSIRFCGLLVWGLSTAVMAADPAFRPKPPEPADESPRERVIPDLRELLARPRNEFDPVARLYDADRGSLERAYPIPGSLARHGRLDQFHAAWLAAVDRLDASKLSRAAQADREKLRKRIAEARRALETSLARRAEIAPLLPFAAAIIDLDEKRRRMEPVEPVKAAAKLTDVKKQLIELRAAVEKAVEKKDGGNEKFADLLANPRLAVRTAEAIASLQATLKNWYSFYDGYDPVFSWWMAEPYKSVDRALTDYARLLRNRASEPAEEKSQPADETPSPSIETAVDLSDAPELAELIAKPANEMEPIVVQYRADQTTFRRGRRGPRNRDEGRRRDAKPAAKEATPVDRAPVDRAPAERFYRGWLGAMEKLDFDSLSHDGRVDYLLLANHIQRELRRLDLAGATTSGATGSASAARRDSRSIGREMLTAELAAEMIAYSPEELIAIAEREFAWCDAEYKKAARDMGFGDDWRRAVEKVKTMHVEPGKQPEVIRQLAVEAIDYVTSRDLVTVPPLAAETWRMEMMSPERQLINPFFTGGEVISVSFPTPTMSHEAKLQSMRGNNIPFSRATVQHELIPGHHLQGFMTARHKPYRGIFSTSFWGEGWALYWEMLLWDMGFPRTPEERVGMLFWRSHRCARIVFSLNFHLGKMSEQQCIDYLVARVGHERDNATAEVRRSFGTSYGALYQAAYMLGGLQIRALHKELVGGGKMTNRQFHDRDPRRKPDPSHNGPGHPDQTAAPARLPTRLALLRRPRTRQPSPLVIVLARRRRGAEKKRTKNLCVSAPLRAI